MQIAPALLLALRLLLAVVFAVSAFAKFADRRGFTSSLESFGVPDRLRPSLAWLIPVSELAIGLGLLAGSSAWVAGVAALGLLVLFTLAIAVNLVRGRRPECHCFGQLSSAPVGWGSVVRNVVLVGGAAAVTLGGRVNAGPSVVAWAAGLPSTGMVVLAAGVVIVGVVAVETWVLAHVLRQNGRLLLRLDAVEASLAQAGVHTAPSAPSPVAVPQAGLPVGVPAPAFQLDRLDGVTTASAELLALGKPLALVFVDPHCGPCTALLPELERWHWDLAHRVTLAVITSGTIDANNSKLAGRGLAHVLVQQDREVSEAYRAFGTPSMVIVEADGTVGSPVGGGRDAIRRLMARFMGMPQPQGGAGLSRGDGLAPNGSNGAHNGLGTTGHLRIGETAPDLHLPGLDGKQVSLSAMRGHPTLVLFWNPGCGFCQRILGDIRAWETSRADRSPQLLVVSAGGAEVNRAMGLRSPVVLDEAFESSRAFGASGTPSAVMVDKDGRVASPLAVGGPAVLTLATEQVTAAVAGG
jgi:thiol-disulfide isomerase/thioredoxin/uncharacterized membrane protein YphA (DoxX/SURF4 family)